MKNQIFNKKRLVLGLAATALFTNSLYAHMDEEKVQMPKEMMVKHIYMKSVEMKPQHKMHKDIILDRIMMLDLTKEQGDKIREILSAKNENISHPFDAFSQTNFDKEKYFEILTKNKELKLKDRVEKLAKVYALLSKEQKKDLKTILEMEKLMKKKMMGKPEFRR